MITLPLSVVRWIAFLKGSPVPPAATFAAVMLFGLSGTCNTILLLTTRPESGLFTRTNDSETGFAPSSTPLQPREILASDSTVEVKENDLGTLR